MAITPGKFHFKVKSYNNEEGEYSPWELAEPGNIIQFIMGHWFNETLPNNLDIIVIKNEKGDQLVIDHENKDVFRFFLISAEQESLYHYKMTDIRFMFFTLEHFFSGLLDTLRENMNQTSDDWRWAKGDFLHKDFYFSVTRWRLVRHFYGLAGFVGVNLVFILISVVAAFTISKIALWMPLGFIAISSAIYLRNHIRNFKWYLDQRELKVQLSRGDRFIHVSHHGEKKSIAKAEIVSIDQHCVRDWADEIDDWITLYTTITFQNGDILNLHRILVPQDLLLDKFHQERHLFQVLNSNKRAVEKPTSLLGYMPNAYQQRYNR